VSTSVQLGYTVTFTSVHTGKYRTEDKLKTDITKNKYNPEKANNAKQSITKLAWFSHFLRQSARKRGGLILQHSPSPHGLGEAIFKICQITHL